MINTIFYFVKTDAEYRAKRAAGEISNKTITFVEDTREIYLNGFGYGKSSTEGLATLDDVDDLREEIEDSIDAVDTIVQDSKNRLDELLLALDGRINTSILNALHDAADLRANAELNGLINTKIGEWEQQASLVTLDSTQWTNLTGTVNSLSATVNRINGNYDSNGNFVPTAALQSIIDQRVSENSALVDISSRYAVLSENQNIIEWLASGFTSEVTPDSSFASVYAAQNTATSNAISGLLTSIDNLGNTYVAKSSLISEINNKITGGSSLSGIATEAYADHAASLVFAETVGNTGKTVSALLVQSDLDHASLSALSQTVTSQGTTIAGLQTTTGLDTAVAALIAQDGSGVKAAVETKVTDGITHATISANQINLEGLVTANNNFKIMNDGSMETVAGKIGGWIIESSTIKSVVNSYDNNNVVVSTKTLKLNSNDAQIVMTLGASGIYKHAKFGATGIETVSESTTTNKLSIDGSGLLAGGAISWDTAGNIVTDASKLTINNTLNIRKATPGTTAINITDNNTFNLFYTTLDLGRIIIGKEDPDYTTGPSPSVTKQGGVKITDDGIAAYYKFNDISSIRFGLTLSDGLFLKEVTSGDNLITIEDSNGTTYTFDLQKAIDLLLFS